jgi:hypothetical protein
VQDSRFVITSFPEFSAGNEKVSRAKRRGQSNGLCHDAYLHHKRSFQNMEENNFGDFCGGATFDRKVAIHNIWAYFSGKLIVNLSLMLPLIEMSSQY